MMLNSVIEFKQRARNDFDYAIEGRCACRLVYDVKVCKNLNGAKNVMVVDFGRTALKMAA